MVRCSARVVSHVRNVLDAAGSIFQRPFSTIPHCCYWFRASNMKLAFRHLTSNIVGVFPPPRARMWDYATFLNVEDEEWLLWSTSDANIWWLTIKKMAQKLEVNGNVTGNLLIKVENFEICSLSHQQTRCDYLLPSARRVRRFIFVFFLLTIEVSWWWKRTWTRFTFKAPLTSRSFLSLQLYWTSKALQLP